METSKKEIMDRLGISYFQDNGSGFASIRQLNELLEHLVKLIPGVNVVRQAGDVQLEYGLNVIGPEVGGGVNAYFPVKAIKGQSVTVINSSGYVVLVRSREAGASINGVTGTFASVPADNKSYTFTCYENPLPGAWTWTPPATGQIDSREIVLNGLTDSKRFFIIDSNTVVLDTTNAANTTFWADDGMNKPSRQFGPGPGMVVSKFMNCEPLRLKIYSNAVDTANPFLGFTFHFAESCQDNYYYPNTFIKPDLYQGAGSTGTGLFMPALSENYSMVPGSPLVPNRACSPDIGDPGTWSYIREIAGGSFNGLTRRHLGDLYKGQITNNGSTFDVWQTRFTALRIHTSNFSVLGAQNLKLRFFIEYA